MKNPICDTYQTTDGYQIETIKTIQDIESIRTFWQSVHKHPNSDIDFYLSIIRSRSNIIRPHVLLIKHYGTPIALLVGRIEHFPFSLAFGYKILLKFEIPALVVLYQGHLGENSNKTCQYFFNEIRMLLSSKEIGLVFLSSLKNDGLLFDLHRKKTNLFFRDHFPVPNIHWQMTIPESMNLFYSMRSRKHRYWLRRISKVLDKDFTGNIKFKTYMNQEEVDTLCSDVEEIAKHTYHRGMSAGFTDNLDERNLFKQLAKNRALRGYVLYVKERPAAFWMGRQYHNTFYLAYTGYLPEYEKYELGTILFLRMLEDLIDDKTISYIDFGFGDAAYKRRFGDSSWEESSVYLFPHTTKGFLLNTARTFTALTYQLSIQILQRFNLLEKVKKIWRRKLRTANAAQLEDKERS